MPKSVVGVIGPEDLVQRVVNLQPDYPALALRPLPYARLEDPPQVVRQHQHELDIILFTSPIQELQCRNVVNFTVPVICVPFSPSSLYRALFQARGLLLPNSAGISVDGLSWAKTREALFDLGLPTDPVHAFELSGAPPRHDELISFHLNLWRQGKVRLIFTYYRAGYHKLRRSGAPAFLIDPEAPVLHEALQMVLLEAKALRSKDAQLVFGLVNIDGFSQIARTLGSEYEVQRFKLQFQTEIVNLVQPLSGVPLTAGTMDTCVVTTRGAFEDLSTRFSRPIFLPHIQERLGITVSEGWGAGPVADTARRHAETALRLAKQAGGSCAFVVLDDTQTIGPLGKLESVSAALTSLDPEVVAVASSAGVSARTVERVRFLVRKLGRAELTSMELAQELNMTERNARRILQRLASLNLAAVSGQDFSYPRGRPRRVYRILPPFVP